MAWILGLGPLFGALIWTTAMTVRQHYAIRELRREVNALWLDSEVCTEALQRHYALHRREK